ncbi:MAG: hypothetical protein IJ243_01280 [Prevotella sp.]|nr:hypothetical protein [Prevotella sp.]
MKRLLFILSFLICQLSFSETLAQSGLKINDLFEGRVIPQERMVETRVRGKSIAKYQLSYYRSLRLSATDKEAGQLRQLLGQDADRSIDMRTSRQNPHRWDTWTCKLQMPSAEGKNRFVCYQEHWDKAHEQCEVTVIYMEGTVESLEQLEELLK